MLLAQPLTSPLPLYDALSRTHRRYLVPKKFAHSITRALAHSLTRTLAHSRRYPPPPPHTVRRYALLSLKFDNDQVLTSFMVGAEHITPKEVFADSNIPKEVFADSNTTLSDPCGCVRCSGVGCPSGCISGGGGHCTGCCGDPNDAGGCMCYHC